MNKRTSTKETSMPLVAIDLGTYEFVAMAAEMIQTGDEQYLRILGVERTSRYNCIKHGVIVNTSDAGYNIKEMLRKLGNRIGYDDILPYAFITTGGKSMQLALASAKRFQGMKHSIPKSVISEIESECRDKVVRDFQQHGYVSLQLTPFQYILDDEVIYERPNSTHKALYVEGQYTIFIGNRDLVTMPHASFERTGIAIEHEWVRPEAHVTALVGEEDEREGCAILDLGDQTTTLTVFKQGRYLSSRTIPLGGYLITRDIEQMGIPFAIAQKLKHTFGLASVDSLQQDQTIKLPSSLEPNKFILLKRSELADIINMRLQEILQYPMHDLKRFEGQIGKLYITGGGAMLGGMVPYLQSLTSIPVQFGSHAEWLDPETDMEYYKPQYSGLIGTLALGATYREEHPESTKNKGGFLGIFKNRGVIKEQMISLFDGETEINNQH